MKMVPSLFLLCILPLIPGGSSLFASIVAQVGGVARLNCSAPTGGSVEWKRRLPKQFSYIYVHPWLHKPYDTGGRHNVSLDPLTGACDLVITNVTEVDAGKYICTETIGRSESHFELVLLVDYPTCPTNLSLTNVLVDNDCDIDPDSIEFNCSIAYRGNVAPDMQLQMSSIGVLDNVTVRTWQQSTTTYMSVVWASKASWRMSGGQFRCEVMNTMVGIQPTCSSTNVSIIYFYKSNRSLVISPSSMDNQAPYFETCAANTSEQCSYSWRGADSNSSKSSSLQGATIDLKSQDGLEHASMLCRAECRIRNNTCVSEPMFIQFLSDDGVAGDKSSSKINHGNNVLPVVLLSVGIFLVILIFLIFI